MSGAAAGLCGRMRTTTLESRYPIHDSAVPGWQVIQLIKHRRINYTIHNNTIKRWVPCTHASVCVGVREREMDARCVALRRYYTRLGGEKEKRCRGVSGGGWSRNQRQTITAARQCVGTRRARCSSDFSRQITFLTINPRDDADNRRLIKLLRRTRTQWEYIR